MSYFAFHFVQGATRTHLLGWTGKRWKNPCGILTTSQYREATLTLPLCKTCAGLTAQLDTYPSSLGRGPR